MPFSTTTLVRFTAKLSRCLSLALLPALASEARAIVGQPQRKQNLRPAQISASSPTARKTGTVPYLAALGPLPLRFARPGPEPTDEPPAPPEPKVIALVVTPNPEADKTKPSPESPAAPESEIKVPQPEHAPEPVSEFEEPNAQPALRILPDDTRREIRPEDVLPFFRYPAPAASGEPSVQVVVPLPSSQSQSTQPSTSSATYQQQ